jgi:hypothetical protein
MVASQRKKWQNVLYMTHDGLYFGLVRNRPKGLGHHGRTGRGVAPRKVPKEHIFQHFMFPRHGIVTDDIVSSAPTDLWTGKFQRIGRGAQGIPGTRMWSDGGIDTHTRIKNALEQHSISLYLSLYVSLFVFGL